MLFLMVFTLFNSISYSSESNVDSSWTVLGAPYVSYSSDYGFVFGLGLGAAQGNDKFVALTMNLATKGNYGIGVRGEVKLGKWRVGREINYYRLRRYLYSPTGSPPDTLAKVKMDQFKLHLSALTAVAKNLEIGPELYYSYAKGREPQTKNDLSLSLDSLPEFQLGTDFMVGARGRYRTVSPVRPMNGMLLETGIRVGRTTSDYKTNPEINFAVDARAMLARKISSRIRIYLRGEGEYQYRTPHSVRAFIGGEQTLRGQPDRRDFGRRKVLSRAQLHVNLIHDWLFPSQFVNRVIPFAPVQPLEIEAIAFHDAGIAGDPDCGWRRTRHGYGAGLRFIVPPELIFHIDYAITPEGLSAVYFGAGATL
ncbi:hypothetical protein K8I28_11250 [bacterium]|nr:hypothetical protein [bacterium]